MSIPIVQIDAFSDRPFSGNPAAVCLLPEAKQDSWMQKVAAEMNLSETAFLLPQSDGYNLRWFTPKAEVKLCGHATLASAFFLWSEGHLAKDKEARFYTKSGLLTATYTDGWITLNFPVQPPQETTPPPNLIEALGVTPTYIGKNEVYYLIEVESEKIIQNLKPNFSLLKTVDCTGVIVTSPSENPKYDFISRFFAPQVGIDEDPVTGSAHCSLTPFWSDRLSKKDLFAYQASPRGGDIRCRWKGERVLLSGQAITVMRGKLIA